MLLQYVFHKMSSFVSFVPLCGLNKSKKGWSERNGALLVEPMKQRFAAAPGLGVTSHRVSFLAPKLCILQCLNHTFCATASMISVWQSQLPRCCWGQWQRWARRRQRDCSGCRGRWRRLVVLKIRKDFVNKGFWQWTWVIRVFWIFCKRFNIVRNNDSWGETKVMHFNGRNTSVINPKHRRYECNLLFISLYKGFLLFKFLGLNAETKCLIDIRDSWSFG